MAFCTKNTLFVRNLSPQVSEAVLRETFGKCDVVERVLFRSFPGRATEYFAQIDFRTSAGVTEGFKLSGTPILGVVCQVSVMDPGSKAMMKQLWETREQQLLPPDEEAPHPSEPQGVQAEYMRRWKEAEEDKRLRTVHIAGLTDDATEEGLRLLCGQFGEVLDLRMDKDGDGKCFGLVEFKDRNIAYAVKARAEFLVDGRTLVFSEAKTLVDTKAFAEQSVHFSTPIFDASTMKAVLAYQCHLNPKLAKARAAAAEIMNEPVPPETEAMLKQAEEAQKEKEPEPVQWPGRSEKDSTQWPWRPADSARQRRSSRSRERRRRGRGSRSRDRSGGRGRPRREGRSSRSRSRRRRRKDAGDGRHRRRRKDGEDAIDLDDEDVAVVPNTEMLVLGESSSYSDCSQSPAREGKDAAAAAAAAGPAEIPEPPAPECHEIPDLPSPVRSIAESLPGEEVDVVAADCEMAPGEEAPASDAARDPAGSAAATSLGSDAAPRLGPEAGEAAPLAEGPGAAEGGGAAGPRPAGDAGGVGAAVEAAEDESRGLETGTATSSRARPDVAPTRWECGGCGEVNKPSRTQCNNCGASAPWVKKEEPVEDVDELSTPSERSPSPARSLGESPPSPARSVQESPPSPARSIAASGSARSVAESERSPARSIPESEGGLVDIAESNSEKGDEECEWAAERVRGEIADARARIFHETGS